MQKSQLLLGGYSIINVDLTNLYCHVDDFCKEFEPRWNRELLSSGVAKRRPRSSLSLSEVMTIVIWFHFSGSRDFKHYYLAIATFHKNDYKGLVSYSQFVTLMKEAIIAVNLLYRGPSNGQRRISVRRLHAPSGLSSKAHLLE